GDSVALGGGGEATRGLGPRSRGGGRGGGGEWRSRRIGRVGGARAGRVEGEVAIRGSTPPSKCPAQLAQRIEHFAGRDQMDIEGMGPAVVESLLKAGLVHSPANLYRLTKEQLLELPRFAERSAAKLIDNIEKSKSQDLARVVDGLGIPQVGHETARLLASTLRSLERLAQAPEEQLARIEGIGPSVAASIRTFFAEPENQALVRDLTELGIGRSVGRVAEDGSPDGGTLGGGPPA